MKYRKYPPPVNPERAWLLLLVMIVVVLVLSFKSVWL